MEYLPGAPGAPTNAPLPIGVIDAHTLEPGAIATSGRVPAVIAPGTTSEPARRRVGRPFSYASISVQFNGDKWVMAGPSIPERPRGLTQIGEYRGFPVYAERGRERELIYLPFSGERMAPFKPSSR